MRVLNMYSVGVKNALLGNQKLFHSVAFKHIDAIHHWKPYSNSDIFICVHIKHGALKVIQGVLEGNIGHRQTVRKTDRYTDRQADRQTYRHTYKQIDIQTDRKFHFIIQKLDMDDKTT